MTRNWKRGNAGGHRSPASITACITVLISVALLPCAALAAPGDMNCDGAVNVADIPLFVDALLASGSFGGCDIHRADMNADGLINGRDTQPFVAALLGPQCSPGNIPCNGTCVTPTIDPHNCGGCGVECAENEACINGFCESG